MTTALDYNYVSVTYNALKANGHALDRTELSLITGFTPKTVREALNKLKSEGLIKSIPTIRDMRMCKYAVRDEGMTMRVGGVIYA